MIHPRLLRHNSKATLAVGFVLLALFLAANALVSYRNLRRLLKNDAEVAHSRLVLGELQGLLLAVQAAESGGRAFVISGDGTFLAPYRASEAEASRRLARLRETVRVASVRVHLPGLETAVASRFESMDANVAVRRAQGFEAARRRILTGVGRRRMDAVRRAVGETRAAEEALLAGREAESASSGRRATLALGISALATLGLLGAVALALRRDMARRERADDQAREAAERLAAIVESTSQIVWTRDAQGRFEEPQPTWSAFTGLPFEAIRGVGWQHGIHPDDRTRVVEGWARAVADPGPYRIGYRLLHADGGYRDMAVHAVPVRAEDGSVREWVGTSTDVTERMRAETDLRRSEARNVAILNTALDCIVAIDATNHVVEWNPAAEKTFGYAREEAVGSELGDLIVPSATVAAHRAGLARYLVTGEGPLLGRRIELTARRKDGREIPIELAIQRIEGSEPAAFSAYIRDIGHRKEADAAQETAARLAGLAADVGLALTRDDALRSILQECAEALARDLNASVAPGVDAGRRGATRWSSRRARAWTRTCTGRRAACPSPSTPSAASPATAFRRWSISTPTIRASARRSGSSAAGWWGSRAIPSCSTGARWAWWACTRPIRRSPTTR